MTRRCEHPSNQDLHGNAFVALQRWFQISRFRHVPPTFLVSLGCHLASGLWSGASSTYICPLVVGQTRTVPFMQFVGAVLDCYLAITAYELCRQEASGDHNAGANTPPVWGSALLVRKSSVMSCASWLTTVVPGGIDIVDRPGLCYTSNEPGTSGLACSNPITL